LNLEEMQAEIIRLGEVNTANLAQIATLDTDAMTLKESIATLTTDKEGQATKITELQLHNQKLFLKITTPPEPDKPDEPKLSLEDFAKTMKF